MVVAPGSATSAPSFPDGQANLFILESDEPFSAIFNRFVKPFSEIVYYEDKLFRLDEAARTNGDRLAAIISTAGSILRNPLWCVSKDALILEGYAPSASEMDPEIAPAICSAAETGIFPNAVDLKNIRKRDKTHNDIGEIVVAGCTALVLPIYVHGIKVADLVAPAACRPFSRFDRRLLRRTARYVYEVFFKDKSLAENSEVQFSSYLTQLLHNQMNSDAAIDYFIERAKLNTNGNCFYIMTIRPRANAADTHDIFYIASHFKGLLTGRPYAIDGPNFVVLLNLPVDNKFSETPLFESLRARAEELGQVIGISQRFYNLRETSKAYANALIAAQIGAELRFINGTQRPIDKVVFFFWQVMPLALIREANASGDVRKFVDPVITDLMQYDKEHNSDYAYSLYCYLTNLNNYSDAALEANIHKNTLVYRIRRIEEMYHISLSDRFHSFRLHLSFIILMYLNELDERY